MQPMSPEEERQRGLTRERLVEAALSLVNEEGLEGLSMRALADKLDVKAASLYWHIRDRRELLDMLAESILEGVARPRRRGSWREYVLAIADALGRRVAAQRDAGRILLEVPGSLGASDVFRILVVELRSAGLDARDAFSVALTVMTTVVTAPAREPAPSAATLKETASIAIDTGSRGVVLRAGPPHMDALIRVPPDQAGAAPAVVRGEQVVVRRLRGVGRGEIELNPMRPWKFKVQAPTWNTRLDLDGLDVREIWIDSGAANVECFLGHPHGVVPLHVSSGVVNVAMHRPPDAAVVAIAHPGALKLKLDELSTKVTVLDLHWQSQSAFESRDRYELDISSGVVDFRLDTYTPSARPVDAAWNEPPAAGPPGSALEILLDGVEARIKARS